MSEVKKSPAKASGPPASGGKRPRSTSTSARVETKLDTSPKSTQDEDSTKAVAHVETKTKPTDDPTHAAKEQSDKKPRPTVKPRPGKAGQVLKIVQLKGTVGEKEAPERVLATLSTAEINSGATLGAIRAKLGKRLSGNQEFCYPDGSATEDELLLSTYFEHLDEEEDIIQTQTTPKEGMPAEPPSAKSIHRTLYVLPPNPVETKKSKTSSVLDKGNFVIKVSEWQNKEGQGGDLVHRGNIQSKSLGAADVSLLTLAGLRKHISAATPMSSGSKLHKFCTTSGESVLDESMTFSDYIKLQEVDIDESASIPSVFVTYKLDSAFNHPKVDISTLPGSYGETAKDIAVDKALTSAAKTADAFPSTSNREFMLKEWSMEFGEKVGIAKSAGLLTEQEWRAVLNNCGVMYGWVIDREKNQIYQAPKPAFRLRAKATDDPVHKIPDFLPAPISKPPQEPANMQQPPESPTQLKRLAFLQAPATRVLKSRLPLNSKKASIDDLETTNNAPAQDHVEGEPRACPTGADVPAPSVDGPDAESSQTGPPPATIRQLTPDVSEKTVEVNTLPPKSSPSNPPDGGDEGEDVIEDGDEDGDKDEPSTEVTQDQANVKPPPKLPTPSLPATIPSFRVNDNSRIEVTMSTHEFETSMAKNDFSSHSTEGSMSGGFAGWSASVSAGYASEKSTTSKVTTNSYKKTMIAKYLFPRADIFLHPDDMEPTPELARAIENIEKNKNIKDLRNLQRDFGQLFCQQVTVGGRLQSTQIMDQTKTTSEQEQKEEFKVSVGVQVSSPFGVGGGVKHNNAGGKVDSQNVGVSTGSQKNVFEAVGGNTILAADPPKWALSVADHNNWRVINREALTPLADHLSAIQGYSFVKNFFVQAVPKLSEYIELPPSREIKVRLQLSTPTTQLSMAYLKGPDAKRSSANPIYYLGHPPNTDVEPKAFKLVSQNQFWGRLEEALDAAGLSNNQLFTPGKFRAPVILGYGPNATDVKPGSERDTIWTITAPFNDTLQHNSRVSLRTSPKDPSARPSTLALFRSREGTFLSGMSDADDVQYWRILKRNGVPGENIKDGDEVRLCWSFADQTAGYRDFTDDVFGRRRVGAPPGLDSGVLWPKLPWPRFEKLRTAEEATGLSAEEKAKPGMNAMLMSTVSSEAVQAISMPCRQSVEAGVAGAAYAVQDLCFRIDTVANEGRGDTDDYLLKDVKQAANLTPEERLAALGQELERQYQQQQRQRQQLMYKMFFL